MAGRNKKSSVLEIRKTECKSMFLDTVLKYKWINMSMGSLPFLEYRVFKMKFKAVSWISSWKSYMFIL